MQTRLNAETTAISNDYTKKLREEMARNTDRINELQTFVNALEGYKKEVALLQQRNIGLSAVVDTINTSIMKPIDEAAIVSPLLTINPNAKYSMQINNDVAVAGFALPLNAKV